MGIGLDQGVEGGIGLVREFPDIIHYITEMLRLRTGFLYTGELVEYLKYRFQLPFFPVDDDLPNDLPQVLFGKI